MRILARVARLTSVVLVCSRAGAQAAGSPLAPSFFTSHRTGNGDIYRISASVLDLK